MMNIFRRNNSGRLLAIISVTLTLLLLGLLLRFASTTQAGPELPPRDPPTPTPTLQTGNKDKRQQGDKTSLGAYIELQVQPAREGLWAVVQWQDKAGNWHDVEGWRGALGADSKQRWWVAAKDFGSKSFRWNVYQGQNGPQLGVSAAFYLPNEANQTVQVIVSIGP